MFLTANQAMVFAHGAGAGHGGGGRGFFLFPLLMLLLLGFLFFRLKRGGRYRSHVMGRGGPLNVLGERFARGEITRDEYEYRRAVLAEEKDVPEAPPQASPPPDIDDAE